MEWNPTRDSPGNGRGAAVLENGDSLRERLSVETFEGMRARAVVGLPCSCGRIWDSISVEIRELLLGFDGRAAERLSL